MRDITLDYAKAILIILMVLGHALQYSFGAEYTSSGMFFDDNVFKSIYSFHMPLFMLISGYLFYNSSIGRKEGRKEGRSVAQFLLHKFKAIGIPMLSFVLLNTFLFEHKIVLQYEGLKGVIVFIYSYVGIMWFLTSLLINATLLVILSELCKNKCLKYIMMFLVCVGGMFVPFFDIYGSMLPFFCIGYVLKENKVYIYKVSENKTQLCVFTLLSVMAICWFDYDTYIYTSGYFIVGDFSNQLFINMKRIIIGLVVSYTFMQFVYLASVGKNVTDNRNSLLSQLGQMTLFIYGFQTIFFHLCRMIMSVFSINIEHNYFTPLLFTLACFVLSYLFYELLNKSKVTRLLFLGK